MQVSMFRWRGFLEGMGGGGVAKGKSAAFEFFCNFLVKFLSLETGK